MNKHIQKYLIDEEIKKLAHGTGVVPDSEIINLEMILNKIKQNPPDLKALPKISWDSVAQVFKGRTGVDCMIYYYHNCDNNINHLEWTDEEDGKLLEIVENNKVFFN